MPTTRLLLLEDHPAFALMLMAWFANEKDVEVTHASDLPDAMDLLKQNTYDVFFADISLPSGASFDLISTAKQHNPRLQVVMMTSHERADYAVKALRSRADEFLFKPFEHDTVIALLARLERERRLHASSHQSVLAIGAHPDDVELGCGGTLRMHALKGDSVMILTLSGGDAGGVSNVRREESRTAAVLMGASLQMADLPDTHIGEGAETIRVIEEAIAACSPSIVYTHSEHDGHQDHRNVFRATVVAARRVPTLLCYQAPSATVSFRPSRFTEITKSMADKQAAIAAYESQVKKRPYMTPALIESTARYWGRFAGYGLCEPFEAIRELSA
jgi:LmbE family N-acetylglucosaminyl deacetylase